MAFYDDFEARRQQVLGNKTPSQIATGANNGSTANSQFSASVNKGGTGTYSDFEKRRQQVLTAKPTVTTPTPTAKPTVTVTTPVAKASTNPIQGVIDSIKKIADTAIAGLTGQTKQPVQPTTNQQPTNNQPISSEVKNLPLAGMGTTQPTFLSQKNVFDSVPSSATLNNKPSAVNPKNPINQAVQDITKTISSNLPATSELFSQLNSKPDIHKALGIAWDTYSGSIMNEAQTMRKYMDTYANPKSTEAAKIGSKLEVIAGGAGVIFAPISALFSAAAEIPVVAPTVRLINIAYSTLNEGATAVSNKVIDSLPFLTKQEKEQIKPGIGQIFSLAVLIGAGKVIDAGTKAKLTDKYGEVDTQTIMDQAKLMAQTENKALIQRVVNGTGSPKDIETYKTLASTGKLKEFTQTGHGGYLLSTAGENPVFTPEQLTTHIEGTDLKGTPLAKEIETVIKTATDSDKSIQIVTNPPTGIDTFKNPTPQGNKLGYILTQPVTTTLLSEQGGTASKPVEQPVVAPTENAPQVNTEAPTKVVSREVIKLDNPLYTGVKTAYATIMPNGSGSIHVELNPQDQKKGQGTAIVKELEQKLQDKGVSKVEIKSFTEAQGFWEKQGYTVVPGSSTLSKGLVKMDKTLPTTQTTPKAGVSTITPMEIKHYEGIRKEFPKVVDEFKTFINSKPEYQKLALQHSNATTAFESSTAYRKLYQLLKTDNPELAAKLRGKTVDTLSTALYEIATPLPSPTEVVAKPQAQKTTPPPAKKPSFTSKEAQASQADFTKKLDKLRNSAKDQADLIKKARVIVDEEILKFEKDPKAMAGLRTALNKEMFGQVGQSGKYKADYAQLQTLMQDPEIGDYLSMLEDKVAEIDKKIKVPEAESQINNSATFNSTVIPGLDKFIEQDVAPAISGLKTGTVKTWDLMKKILSPTSRGESAKLTASIMRENLARMERNKEIVYKKLEESRKIFDRYSTKQSLEFIDKLEAGEKIEGAEKFTQVMRESLDSRWKIIQDLKGTDAYIENYFPHIFKKPGEVGKALVKSFTRRPFQGSKSYLKHRKFATIKDVMELTDENGKNLGFEPASYNPVDLVMARLADMERFIMAQNTWKEFKNNGLLKYVPVGKVAPDGWIKINDSIATVFYKPTVTEHFDEHLMNTLNEIADSFGIKHERVITGKGLGGRRLGVSFTGQNLIKTKFATPESVILHEIGHQLDPKFNIQTKFAYGKDTGATRINKNGKTVETKESLANRIMLKNELRKLADTRWQGKEVSNNYKQYVRKGEEKVAVMFEAYLHAPTLFKKVAPHVYKQFVDLLKSDQRLKPVLDLEPTMAYGSKTHTMNVLAKGGDWLMPEQAATIVNNYLSPGLIGNPLYQGFRMIGNNLNQVQLGLSVFHATFTSIDAIISRVALGVQQLSEGKPIKGAKTIISSPIAFVTNVFTGDKLLKDYYRDNPEIPDIVLALERAGGRIKMDKFYLNNSTGSFMKSLRSGNILGAGLRMPGAIIQTLARPILQELVPRQKLGIFSDLARDILEEAKKKNWDDRLTTLRLQEAWDSVDNRMGQLVYDNLFWNKTLKDLALISTRSVGWNLGTVREGGGGIVGWASLPLKLFTKTGRANIRMTPKMAYALVYPIIIAILGAIIGYLYGNPPKELKDYFYPKNGKKNPDGTDERISIPSYMKDVFAYTIEPGQTVLNKMYPLISILSDMLQNQDYYGTEIRNSNDPLVKQIGDEFKYFIKAWMPFSVSGALQSKNIGDGLDKQIISFLGFMPAPGYVTKTPLQKEISDIYSMRNQGVKTQESFAKSQAKSQIRNLYLQGKVDEANTQMKALGLTKTEASNLVDSADVPSDIRLFKLLQQSDQEDLIKKMDLYDLTRYGWYANTKVKAEFSSLSPSAKNFVELINDGKIKRPIWQRNQNINK